MFNSTANTMGVKVNPVCPVSLLSCYLIKMIFTVCLNLFAFYGDDEWGIISHSTLLHQLID